MESFKMGRQQWKNLPRQSFYWFKGHKKSHSLQKKKSG